MPEYTKRVPIVLDYKTYNNYRFFFKLISVAIFYPQNKNRLVDNKNAVNSKWFQ